MHAIRRRRARDPRISPKKGTPMKEAWMHLLAGSLAFASLAGAQAAEITVLSSNGVKTVLKELGPQFEKVTRHKLVFHFSTAAELKAQIEKGAAFDVTILTAAAIDDLI